MVLAPLATTADLEARNIDTSDTALVDALLAAASAAIRDAAGVPITETTATIMLPTPEDRRLQLPGPVRSVASVLLDGEAITDWKLRGNDLWLRSWQCPGDIPGEVTVTLTFGLPETPADIIDLICNLVGAGVAHGAEGYEARTGVASERIDDYSVQYAQGRDAVISTMELPDSTREWLAARFGGGAEMVLSRS